MNRLALASATLLSLATIAAAQSTKPTLPPTEIGAAAALKASPRHGGMGRPRPCRRREAAHLGRLPGVGGKAAGRPVIHEIFGMTDWVRATTDQLAAEGFIAVAPDLLSGKGPNGGNTDAFKSDDVRAAIGKLTPDDVATRLDAAKAFATNSLARPRRSASSVSAGAADRVSTTRRTTRR